MKNYIGVLDSGIGGASILRAIKSVLPNERFVYLADTKNAPYGGKGKEEIKKIVLNNAQFLLKKYKIKMLIIACNTASSVCAVMLRDRLTIPIICVEPPIKVALKNGYKEILIMATPQTLKTNKTIKRYTETYGEKIKKLGIKELAMEIDKNLNNWDLLQTLLNENLLKYPNTDAIVIGCTHYNFIKRQIKGTLPNAAIISCEGAIARQTRQVFLSKFIQSKCRHKTRIILTIRDRKMEKFLIDYLESQDDM